VRQCRHWTTPALWELGQAAPSSAAVGAAVQVAWQLAVDAEVVFCSDYQNFCSHCEREAWEGSLVYFPWAYCHSSEQLAEQLAMQALDFHERTNP
jgi:hypothetical protein